MSLKPPGGPNTPINSGIAEEGTALPWRNQVNFVGDAVTVTDDSANNRTKVTVRGTPVFNVKDYGAKGDGSTNDWTAAQAAATAAAVNGGILFYPGGYTYKQNAPVTLSSNIRVEAFDATIDISGAGSADSAFTATGSDGAPVSLTANAAAGDLTLTIAAGSEAGFAVDDYVRIRSTRKYDPGYTDTEDGEIGVVSATSSGLLTLRSPLTGLTYTTANSATVTKVAMLSNIDFAGGKIVGLPGTTQKGIKFTSVVKARVTDTEVLNCPSAGVWFVGVQDGRIDRVHVKFSNNAGDGYGANISGASQDCYIDRCYFRGCRHSTSVTGVAGGIARRIFFNGCHGIDTLATGDCYDVHAPAEDIHFRNCHSFDSGNCGFSIECARASVEGCVVARSANHGMILANSTAAPTEFTVTGNSVLKTSGSGMGIRIDQSSLAGAGAVVNFVDIVGNTLSNTASRPIYVVTADTWRFKNVAIVSNVIESPGNTTNGIHVQQADYCTIASNILHNVPGAAAAIRIADVTVSTVANNVTHHAATTTGRSISVTSGVDITFTGNVGTAALNGIVFDTVTTNCVVASNNMRGCTTAYNLSTGAGHVVTDNLPAAFAAVASAATVTLPRHGKVFSITGTTTITSITADTAGREVILVFAGILTLTDGSNLKLAGNFVTTADDTITLVCDGTNWVEVARSIN